MKRITLKQRVFAVCIVVFTLAFAFPIVTTAQNTRAQDARQNAQERRETAQTSAGEHRDAARTRLENAKLKACQNREKAINNIMARISDRGQKQLDLFTTIAERTEKFYTDKGKTLSNYDELTADVTAKKAEAQTVVDTVKSSSVSFTCDGEDPKGVAQTFKDNLKIEITALNAYKTAVKNLIVGVKSVQGTTSSSEGSEQ